MEVYEQEFDEFDAFFDSTVIDAPPSPAPQTIKNDPIVIVKKEKAVQNARQKDTTSSFMMEDRSAEEAAWAAQKSRSKKAVLEVEERTSGIPRRKDLPAEPPKLQKLPSNRSLHSNPVPPTPPPPKKRPKKPVNPGLAMLATMDELARLTQLVDTQKLKNSELERENKTLKIVNRRQELAIQKMDKDNADMPRIVQQLSEELRGLRIAHSHCSAKIANADRSSQMHIEENLRLHDQLQKLTAQLRAKHPLEETEHYHKVHEHDRKEEERHKRKTSELYQRPQPEPRQKKPSVPKQKIPKRQEPVHHEVENHVHEESTIVPKDDEDPVPSPIEFETKPPTRATREIPSFRKKPQEDPLPDISNPKPVDGSAKPNFKPSFLPRRGKDAEPSSFKPSISVKEEEDVPTVKELEKIEADGRYSWDEPKTTELDSYIPASENKPVTIKRDAAVDKPSQKPVNDKPIWMSGGGNSGSTEMVSESRPPMKPSGLRSSTEPTMQFTGPGSSTETPMQPSSFRSTIATEPPAQPSGFRSSTDPPSFRSTITSDPSSQPLIASEPKKPLWMSNPADTHPTSNPVLNSSQDTSPSQRRESQPLWLQEKPSTQAPKERPSFLDPPTQTARPVSGGIESDIEEEYIT
ncbi:hypothetical protein BC829DRAFT_419581 [Chytridium lagenaria]|nr:hypothetical protein BC829DRAFT_419581 [Chytridium lagenaria]